MIFRVARNWREHTVKRFMERFELSHFAHEGNYAVSKNSRKYHMMEPRWTTEAKILKRLLRSHWARRGRNAFAFGLKTSDTETSVLRAVLYFTNRTAWILNLFIVNIYFNWERVSIYFLVSLLFPTREVEEALSLRFAFDWEVFSLRPQ